MINVLGGFFCTFIISAMAWFYEHFVFIHKKNIPADRSVLVPFLASLFPLLLLLVILKVSVLEFFVVNSNSMEPRLKKDDIVLVSKWESWLIKSSLFLQKNNVFEFSRSDVVLFKLPLKDSEKEFVEQGMLFEPLVKRIVLKPSDRFIIDETETVWIEKRYELPTGKRKDCNLIDQVLFCSMYPDMGVQASMNKLQVKFQLKEFECTPFGRKQICQVPKGLYFVIGDNAWFSKDSRHFGFINEKNIIGKVITLPEFLK